MIKMMMKSSGTLYKHHPITIHLLHFPFQFYLFQQDVAILFHFQAYTLRCNHLQHTSKNWEGFRTAKQQ